MAGYQLASRSAGIDEAIAHQLSNWGPAHDALETRLSRTSVNVHSLDNGLICISYTQIAGSEYSGRGGGRVYTHSFILAAAALAPFHFNPFLVLRAFRGAGRTHPRREPPETLDSFELIGRSTGAPQATPSMLAAQLGESLYEKLLWGLTAGQPVYIAADEPLDTLLETVLHLLPGEDRAAVSLSTALKISPRRPFQLQGIAADSALIRQLQRNESAVVIPLCGTTSSPARDTRSTGGTKLAG